MSFKNVIRIENKKRVAGITKPVNYSTEEHIIGTWIDGSTLYEKTIDFGALPNNTTKNVAHNISNIKRIVKVEAIASMLNGNSYPIPYNDMPNPNTGNLGFMVTATQISVITKTNWSAIYGYFTLRYTKIS